MFVDQINGILRQCGTQALHFRVALHVPAYDAVYQPEPELRMIERWDGVDMYVVDTYHLDVYHGDYDPLAAIYGYVRYVMLTQGFQRFGAELPVLFYGNKSTSDVDYWRAQFVWWFSFMHTSVHRSEWPDVRFCLHQMTCCLADLRAALSRA